jgi:hypothetical protein
VAVCAFVWTQSTRRKEAGRASAVSMAAAEGEEGGGAAAPSYLVCSICLVRGTGSRAANGSDGGRRVPYDDWR